VCQPTQIGSSAVEQFFTSSQTAKNVCRKKYYTEASCVVDKKVLRRLKIYGSLLMGIFGQFIGGILAMQWMRDMEFKPT
jgi:hypothetical protein